MKKMWIAVVAGLLWSGAGLRGEEPDPAGKGEEKGEKDFDAQEKDVLEKLRKQMEETEDEAAKAQLQMALQLLEGMGEMRRAGVPHLPEEDRSRVGMQVAEPALQFMQGLYGEQYASIRKSILRRVSLWPRFWIGFLEDPSADVRNTAARKLEEMIRGGKWLRETSVGELRGYADDPGRKSSDSQVQRLLNLAKSISDRATLREGMRNEEREGWIDAYVAALSSNDPEAREKAETWLRKTGEPVVAALTRRAEAASDPETRERCKRVLEQIRHDRIMEKWSRTGMPLEELEAVPVEMLEWAYRMYTNEDPLLRGSLLSWLYMENFPKRKAAVPKIPLFHYKDFKGDEPPHPLGPNLAFQLLFHALRSDSSRVVRVLAAFYMSLGLENPKYTGEGYGMLHRHKDRYRAYIPEIRILLTEETETWKLSSPEFRQQSPEKFAALKEKREEQGRPMPVPSGNIRVMKVLRHLIEVLEGEK